MKTKTRKGTKIELTTNAQNYSIRASGNSPGIGDFYFNIAGWANEENGAFGFAQVNRKRTRVVLTIPKEDYEIFKSDLETKKEADIKKSMKLEIIGFEYEIGCDADSRYNILYEDHNIPYDAAKKRYENDSGIINIIKKMDLQTVCAELEAKGIEPNLATYGGWRLDKNQWERLEKAAKKIQAEKKESQAKKANKANAVKVAKFARAKSTNAKVELSRWITDCNDSLEECSTDIAVMYAMPDGTTQTEISHTW